MLGCRVLKRIGKSIYVMSKPESLMVFRFADSKKVVREKRTEELAITDILGEEEMVRK